MSTVFRILCIVLSIAAIDCYSHSNSSHETPSSMTKHVTVEDMESTKDMQVPKNRQSNFAIGGPVAASLAFVGLNLAFISLLVPFVITAVTVGERRHSREDEGHDLLQDQLNKLRSLYGWDSQGIDHLARSSTKDNRETIDKISRFSQKFLKNLKSTNEKLKRSSKDLLEF